MVGEEPTRSVTKRLRKAGFKRTDAEGSHGRWIHPLGPWVSIPGEGDVKREHKVQIERDGRWWMIHIPELDGLTQARRLGEAELMAREWIAVSTGTPINDITVHITAVTVPGLGDIAPRAQEIVGERNAAVYASEVAQQHAADYVHALTAADIPVRDTAVLLDVSPQRISQIAKAG